MEGRDAERRDQEELQEGQDRLLDMVDVEQYTMISFIYLFRKIKYLN